jgi:hypothetical protein
MAFLYYYPRSTIQVPLSEFFEGAQGTFDVPWTCGFEVGFSVCEAEYKKDTLNSLEELDRAFGVPTECTTTDPVDSESAEGNGGSSAGASNFKLFFAGALALAGFAL